MTRAEPELHLAALNSRSSYLFGVRRIGDDFKPSWFGIHEELRVGIAAAIGGAEQPGIYFRQIKKS